MGFRFSQPRPIGTALGSGSGREPVDRAARRARRPAGRSLSVSPIGVAGASGTPGTRRGTPATVGAVDTGTPPRAASARLNRERMGASPPHRPSLAPRAGTAVIPSLLHLHELRLHDRLPP